MHEGSERAGWWASLDRTTKAVGIAALVLFVLAAALGAVALSRGDRSTTALPAAKSRALRPFGPGPGMGGKRGALMRDFRTTGLDVAAKTIGVSQSDLVSQLRAGKSIADVANAHKVDPQKVISALVDAERKQIDAAVKDGRMPQAFATQMEASLEQMVTTRVNTPGLARMGPGPGMMRGGQPATPLPSPTATALPSPTATG